MLRIWGPQEKVGEVQGALALGGVRLHQCHRVDVADLVLELVLRLFPRFVRSPVVNLRHEQEMRFVGYGVA